MKLTRECTGVIVRFIVKCIANQRYFLVVLLLLFIWGWPNRPSVVFCQGPLGKRDKHVEIKQVYEKSGRDKRHCRCFAYVSR